MKRFATTLLTAGLLAIATQSFAAPKTAAAPAGVSPAERTKIESVVHQYLLDKPEVLIEAMQVLQRKQGELAQKTIKQTQDNAATFASNLFHQANDPVAGNPDGKVTVVEFFDYQCPHCVDMVPVMQAIIKANPDVRVIYKEFPIRGPASDFAARAALAANKQGKYEALSHAIFTVNKPLTNDVILDLAKNNGIDVDKLKKDMDDSSIKDQVKANIKLAQDLKLLGTPALFVGKTDATAKDAVKYSPGQLNQAQLQALIDQSK